MKRLLILFSLLLVVVTVSCGVDEELPETVVIGGVEYRRAYTYEFFPDAEIVDNGKTQRIDGISFHGSNSSDYGYYVAYDDMAQPNIYFKSEEFEAAKNFYSAPENFRYYCMVGLLTDDTEQQIFELYDVDCAILDELLVFAHDKGYNPFDTSDYYDFVKRIPDPDPDEWFESIHFYKVPKNGEFVSYQPMFRIINGKLVLLNRIDFEDDDNPVLEVVELPDKLEQYFKQIYSETVEIM